MPHADPSDPGATAAPTSDAVAARQLRQLARVGAELAGAVDMATVIDAAVNHAAEAIGAAVSTLMLTDGVELVLVSGHGLRTGVRERWARFGIADDNPSSEAVRTGRPVVLSSADEAVARYPVLAGQVVEGRSLVNLPLGAVAPTVGVIGLTFDAGWVPGPTETDFLTAFADACGQAVRRVRARKIAEDRAERLEVLERASAELASSIDYSTTLQNVADLCVPSLADWAAIDLVENGAPVTVAVAHVDPDKVRWAWALQERYPIDPDAVTGSPNVIRTGRSELYPEITDEMLVAGARDEEHLRISRELNLRSAVVVPLPARGRTLGSMTLVRTDGPSYNPDDLALTEDVGRRAGIAIDNAHLYRQTQDVARHLQRAVLPDAAFDIPGWEVAQWLMPGGRDGVGGDFYDALALPDGNIAFVICDVVGHGIAAAAAMAQLRAAVRAFVTLDPDPEQVVTRLDTMFDRLPIAPMATLVYGVAGRGRLRYVSAGHYQPLLRPSAGPAYFAHGTTGLPLGVGRDERSATCVPLGAGDTVLLFTDGLVERRGEIIDVGLERVREAAGRLDVPSLADGLTALVDAVRPAQSDDDVTALALRPQPDEM